jgi:hypothetical protein
MPCNVYEERGVQEYISLFCAMTAGLYLSVLPCLSTPH